MIRKLHIQNFQSHKDSTFTFDKGINVLIGRSDSGKSAIWRALYWLAFNSPSGTAYRSHWGGDTIVEVWTETDHIQKIRTKTQNMYVLNGMELKALRTEVPREIKEALNLTDINFQGQLDSSFLLMSSGGEVARILNEYLDLQSIDKAIQDINSKSKKNTSERSSLRDEEKRQEIALADKKYERVAEFQTRMNFLQIDEKKLQKKEDELYALNILVTKYNILKKSSTDIDIDSFLDRANELLEQSTNLRTLVGKKAILQQAAGRASELSSRVTKSQEKIDELEASKALLLTDACPICGSTL